MTKVFDYTTRARRLSAKYPLLSYILTQVNFWILANVLLGAISFFQIKIIAQNVGLLVEIRLLPFLIIGVIMGVLYGVLVGWTSYLLDQGHCRKYSLGVMLLIKMLVGLAIFSLGFIFVRFVLHQAILINLFPTDALLMQEQSWPYLFIVLFLVYAVTSVIVGFINQMQQKFGPGVLIPILFGKYSNPKEEERIFLFMDLKSSTTIAESLGHLKYSGLIRDAIFDINKLLPKYDAEVYQYVGDEIVITWKSEHGLYDFNCVKFYFACHHQFESRRDYYIEKYGVLPFFKAGMNIGVVAAVEIGNIKRDIAYHGDTINIAARIQGKCNEFGKMFLAGEGFREVFDRTNKFNADDLGSILLNGKVKKVGIISIEELTKVG